MVAGEQDVGIKLPPRKTLVVVLHGWGRGPASMKGVRELVAEVYGPGAHVHAPALPYARRFRSVRAIAVVQNVLGSIDKIVADCGPFNRIVFVGHSLGATIARRVHLVASEPEPAGFLSETGLDASQARAWGKLVERVVLIAAFNRGWAISDRLSWYYSFLFNLAGLIGHLRPGWAPTIFDIRLGAPFIVQTRLHWLAYRRAQAAAERLPDQVRGDARPVLVQVIGTRDDLVSPFDQVDLSVDAAVRSIVVGDRTDAPLEARQRDFFLIEMPDTDHDASIVVSGTLQALVRRDRLRDALLEDRTGLARAAIDPGLLADEVAEVDEGVNDTVFVIHGIRDDGFWTHRIAERIRQAGPRAGTSGEAAFRGWTPTYGYFAMLPFLLPWVRRGKVEWFMDQYVSAMAQYPNATFHYVGHSNGTYLAARSLHDYPALRFGNVLFAGSVVRSDFPWAKYVDDRRVGRLQNVVASGDWVVAWLPKSLEWIGSLDLGGAGFDGFHDARLGRPEIVDFAFVRGGHAAGILEARWEDIARFVVDGTPYALPAGAADADIRQNRFVAAVAVTRLGVPVLVAVLGILIPAAILFLPHGFRLHADGWRAFGLLFYAILLRFVVGRL